jgi:UDP-2,3-diacylglucosamine pyrophosphatase LpxH
MDPVVHDTLIVSDLHLGSEISRARDALRLLRRERFRRLILLGDIFSDLNFRRDYGNMSIAPIFVRRLKRWNSRGHSGIPRSSGRGDH